VTRILDAFGKDIIIVETVGVGQDEIEVVRAADAVAVVCVPGQGDGIQALKAGIMEIGDVFVVNKADRGGADEVVADIEAMLELGAEDGKPAPAVVKTSGLEGEGIDTLVDVLLEMMETRKRNDAMNADRIREEILTLAQREILRGVRDAWGRNGALEDAVQEVVAKKRDPYSVMESMLQTVKRLGED